MKARTSFAIPLQAELFIMIMDKINKCVSLSIVPPFPEILLAISILIAMGPSTYRSYPEMNYQIHCKITCVCVCVCVCIYIYIYMRERERERERARQNLLLPCLVYVPDTTVYLGLKHGLCPAVAVGYAGCALGMDNPQRAFRLGMCTNYLIAIVVFHKLC